MDKEMQKHMQGMQQRAILQCSSLFEQQLDTWPERRCEDLIVMEIKLSPSLPLIVDYLATGQDVQQAHDAVGMALAALPHCEIMFLCM